jgi:hypothetical protein
MLATFYHRKISGLTETLKQEYSQSLTIMLILYLTGFGVFLSVAFYVYSENLAKRRPGNTSGVVGKNGRDMWVATLLDCDFEPAKVRFGPAKIIPADRILNQAAHKDNFSRHMESK